MPIQAESQSDRRRISAKELAEAVHAREPAAFLVEQRVLRRVIKFDRRITSLGLHVPHRKSYVIVQQRLQKIVASDELHPAAPRPPWVILLAAPNPEELAGQSADEVLLLYWRLLFHARVHLELQARLASGQLTLGAVRERIHRIGQTQFDEIRAVLHSEDMLLPPRDDATVFVEFAAVFLELRYFAPGLLPQFFPTIMELRSVESLLAEDVDALALFEETRLAGAAEPLRPPAASVEERTPPSPPLVREGTSANGAADRAAQRRRRVDTVEKRQASNGSPSFLAFQRQAGRAEEVGNLVHGAILRMQAAAATTGKPASVSLAAAHDDLKRLVERLQAALDFPNQDRSAWEEGLRGLLKLCSEDHLTTEGRLLYDLQKVCVDHEREIYTVDLTEWLLSWFQKPIRRNLPVQREVLICKHLRSADRRMAAARLGDVARERVTRVLHEALHRAEDKAREKLRPRIAKALAEAELVPENLPEEVARHKIVEELLDKVVESGYLRFGDLRDAISRSHLKLPDLTTFGRLIFGDHLLRADRELARRLDGVYHRAEVYLRIFQRITSLGFGNELGRGLNRYFIFPLLAAFIVVVFYQEMAHVTHLDRWVPNGNVVNAIGRLFTSGAAASYKSSPGSAIALGSLSLLFFGLINSPRFRTAFVGAMRSVGHAVALASSWVVSFLAKPLVRAILSSRWFLFTRRYVFKPLLFTAFVWLILDLWEVEVKPLSLAIIFVAFDLVLNTRFGRDLEEVTSDVLTRSWIDFRTRVVAGLFWLIVDVSKAFLEGVDRVLYAVDEWLRFRRGESVTSFVGKAVLSVVWFVVTYVVRFAVNLLIEPQINPIKHFPVVTVSHKLILPLAFTISEDVASPLASVLLLVFSISVPTANWIAGSIVWGIPGIFGFIAWELKNNWQLYRANRPATLQPASIGHHGETMIRFMRPGIHSGTLPKLYKKIRRAHRKARRSRKPAELFSRKHFAQLEHVRHSLANYVERELIYLLHHCPAWKRQLTIGHIQMGSNSIRVELLCPELGTLGCWLTFEEQSGWLVVGIPQSGWLASLPPAEQPVLRNALVGLYKTSGAHLLQQQVERLLPERGMPYDVGDNGLVVWPGPGYDAEVVYDVNCEGPIEPRCSRGRGTFGLPVLQQRDLLFNLLPLAWDDWVAAWERRRGERPAALLEQFHVFPPLEPAVRGTPGQPSGDIGSASQSTAAAAIPATSTEATA